jgi:hypothetical protein
LASSIALTISDFHLTLNNVHLDCSLCLRHNSFESSSILANHVLGSSTNVLELRPCTRKLSGKLKLGSQQLVQFRILALEWPVWEGLECISDCRHLTHSWGSLEWMAVGVMLD